MGIYLRTLERHPGGYTPQDLREAPWWVYTLRYTLGGTLVGYIHPEVHLREVSWWVYTTLGTPMGGTLVGITHP